MPYHKDGGKWYVLRRRIPSATNKSAAPISMSHMPGIWSARLNSRGHHHVSKSSFEKSKSSAPQTFNQPRGTRTSPTFHPHQVKRYCNILQDLLSFVLNNVRNVREDIVQRGSISKCEAPSAVKWPSVRFGHFKGAPDN